MIDNLSKYPVTTIPIRAILDDKLTDFSLGSAPDALGQSIHELGITHPVSLLRVENTENFQVICGHRRIAIAKRLGLLEIPARAVEEQIDSATCLKFNILDNIGHRIYSDIEKARIINKLSETGLVDGDLIEIFLPLIGIQPSKKLMDDFLKTHQLSNSLQLLLHENNIPVRVFSILFKWDDSDRDSLEKLIAPLHLGVNKWREFLELADETARRENNTPDGILNHTDVHSIMRNNEISIHKKYDSICHSLKLRRFPVMSEMQKKFLLALDKLDLDPRTKIRAAKYFENDEIKIEIKFSRHEDLLAQVEKLSNTAGSQAMRDLIKIISGTT